MTTSTVDRLVERTGKSATLAKLDSMARKLTGFGLNIILPGENLALSVRPAGQPVVLPPFCRLVQSTLEGKKLCATCHSLMAFGACNLGVSEHTCYGGVYVIAACIHDMKGDLSGSAVVSSCDFAKGNRAAGWRAARSHARKLGVDVKDLRNAYYDLPYLTARKQELLGGLVEVAATALGELLNLAPSDSKPAGADTRLPLGVEQRLRSDLLLSRDKTFRQDGKPAGRPLVDVVSSVVSRYPAMQFTVQDIARAAHMSPNHFSTLFSRHTGQSFVKFLNEKRLSLAEELLRDLTLSVSEVADRAGFEDANYFTRLFKKKTGMTPREWREKL
jgi:AraC-like DNA-binding protein